MAHPTKRSVLDSLTKPQLIAIAKAFELQVARSQPRAEFVEAIASSRRASFEQVLQTLGHEELAKVCRDHGLDDGGGEDRVLVDRLMGRESSGADEAGLGYEPVLTPVPQPAVKPRSAGKKREGAKKAKPTPLHADTSDGDHARWASSTKMRLSRFALDAAAGYRDADGDIACVRDLIRCFGWGPDEELPAEIPAMRTLVAQGARTERRIAAVLRERRAVVDVIDRERSIQDGWTALLPVILQLEPVPQYVVVTNQRDIALYDLRKSRSEPRLSRAVDELPKYSEAFPFLARDWAPGATPQIINVDKVSKEVAELVARVYRSFKAEHPNRGDDVIRFTLQCILAMFAEDIGLLPQSHFTSLLYQAAERGDAEQRLAELFRLMSTPEDRERGDRAIRYFNGGLFSAPVTLPVNREQLTALTKAAEANWTHVDPHIFESVFQGIMDDAERHASGAHYTEKEDIMRVVGPTIVEPWRKRISAAKTLTELRAVRSDLAKFRVLDPACGSGNFLYIAFREMYRLENEIIGRMHEFPEIANDPKLRSKWGSGIPTTNFYGLDINAFAVELARATLNIAKKIAFEERRAFVADRFGQLEMELDPSLPLDNLEANIICADALFCEWPEAEAIVGNPPFLGASKIRAELGQDYVHKLQAENPVVDLVCYWFRRAHDRLAEGARAGLVATSGIRVGKQREAALDYIVARGGTITNAISSRAWPGDSAVNVSMVNWVRGAAAGPHQLIIDEDVYQLNKIPTHLQIHPDVSATHKLAANANGMNEGVNFGHEAFRSSADGFPIDERENLPAIRPVATADDMLRGKMSTTPDYCIYLPHATEEEA
jgi:hypothetical protein